MKRWNFTERFESLSYEGTLLIVSHNKHLKNVIVSNIGNWISKWIFCDISEMMNNYLKTLKEGRAVELIIIDFSKKYSKFIN